MDQKKIGLFLKELRKEKGLTQQQLAEIMNVSNRSISRWETGSNMPDLDLLISIANYYDVELKEILDGERKDKPMEKEMEETVLKVADYSNEEKIFLIKRLHYVFIAGAIAFLVYFILDINGLSNNGGIYENIANFALGLVLGILLCGILYTSRYISKIRAFKKRLLKRNL